MNLYRFPTILQQKTIIVLTKVSQYTQGRGLYKTEYGRPGGLDYRNNSKE